LEKIFNVIQARPVITDAIVVSGTGKIILLLQLKVDFIFPCDSCDDRHVRLIKQVLYAGEVVIINLQYYGNGCSSSAVTKGIIKMTLSTTGSDNYAISSPVPSMIDSF
jgi:hypothetical protein